MPRSSRGSGSRHRANTRKQGRRTALAETRRANRAAQFHYIQRVPYNGQCLAGASPNKFIPPDRYVRDFLKVVCDKSTLKHPHADVPAYLRHEVDMCTVSATTDELYGHLSHYDRPYDHCTPRWFRRRGKHVLGVCTPFSNGSLGHLSDALHPDRVYELQMNWDAKPGLRWKRLGYSNKREAWNAGACECTIDGVSSLLKGERREVSPACAGGRAKLTTKAKASSQRGLGRLVWEMDIEDVAIAQLILNPVVSWCSRHPHNTSIGKSHFFQGGQRLMQHFEYDRNPNQFGVGSDARKMDASLAPWLIREIILRIRQGFTDGEDPRYDELFDFLTRMHTGGHVLMPDNSMFRVEGGTASGATLVSLIESIATEFIHREALVQMIREYLPDVSYHRASRYLSGYLRIQCLGDDNWITCPGPIPFQRFFRLSRLRDLIDRKFGIEIRLDKTHTGYGLPAFFYLSRKLGAHELRATSYREALETGLRWKYPEKTVASPQFSYNRSMGLLIDNPTDKVGFLLDSYLDWLEEEHGVSPDAISLEPFLTGQLGSVVTRRLSLAECRALYTRVRAEDGTFGGPVSPVALHWAW